MSLKQATTIFSSTIPNLTFLSAQIKKGFIIQLRSPHIADPKYMLANMKCG
jgi:hypothetical protein